MHPNPSFRQPGTARNIAFARDRGFGTLAVNAADGPLMSHIPFVLSEDGAEIELHLVRSNPILRLLDAPQNAVISVQGPDAYISPDWYGIDDQVPTWNYIVVHLRGTVERRPDDELLGMLERLSAYFETRLAPKPPWTLNKMSKDALAKLIRMIVPCRMAVTDIHGTWKLNQNKTDAVRASAADAVIDSVGAELAALSALMQNPPDT